MSKIVYVEKDDCTACNQCSDNLPKYFRLDDDGIAESHINGANINAAAVEAADEAAVQNEIDECPGECIHWK